MILTRAFLAFSAAAILLSSTGCGEQGGRADLSARVDSLEARLHEVEERFRPGLHSMMQQVQVRHATLWFAGTEENWALAEYQLHELEELIEEIGEVHPIYEGIPVRQYMEGMMDPAIAPLQEAIGAKDAERFRDRFDRMTDACNGCHVATDRGEIVMQRPRAEPFGNLRFTPAR